MRPVRTAIVAFVALAAVAPADAIAEGGLFDFLFGGSQPEPQQAPSPVFRSRRAVRQENSRDDRSSRHDRAKGSVEARSIEQSGDGFCVRTCDGYFFPLIRSSRATAQQSCEYQCPSAAVEIYQGSSIEQARNAKGVHYASLPNAFSFRDKTTANCSCNDPKSSHAFFQSIVQNDPTLRSGDVVIEDTGAFVYNGTNLVTLGRASFVSSTIRERLHAIMRRNASMKLHEGPAPAAHGSIEFNTASHPTPGALTPR